MQTLEFEMEITNPKFGRFGNVNFCENHVQLESGGNQWDGSDGTNRGVWQGAANKETEEERFESAGATFYLVRE